MEVLVVFRSLPACRQAGNRLRHKDMSPEFPANKIEQADVSSSENSLEIPSQAEDVLRSLAQYSKLEPEELANYLNPDAFKGKILKIDSEGRIILARYAIDEQHLVKEENEATSEMMKRSSISPTSTNNGVVHTSAALNWGVSSDWIPATYPMYGIFKIPVKELLKLAQENKAMVGMLEETEVILSGDIASQYLTETHPASDLQPLMDLANVSS
jgi:hypothetical protein